MVQALQRGANTAAEQDMMKKTNKWLYKGSAQKILKK
jgi:hypothetical protein